MPLGFRQLFAEPLEWRYPRPGIEMKIDGPRGEHIRSHLRWRWSDEPLAPQDQVVRASARTAEGDAHGWQ